MERLPLTRCKFLLPFPILPHFDLSCFEGFLADTEAAGAPLPVSCSGHHSSTFSEALWSCGPMWDVSWVVGCAEEQRCRASIAQE